MHVKSFSISLQLSKVVTENLFSPLRYISDAKLFMSQTLFELKPTQIIDSDADLNCNWTKFKKRKMLISIKLLTKYVIIIIFFYLCISFLVLEKFGIWIKAVPKSLQRWNSPPG